MKESFCSYIRKSEGTKKDENFSGLLDTLDRIRILLEEISESNREEIFSSKVLPKVFECP
jgi:hypothetical protein